MHCVMRILYYLDKPLLQAAGENHHNIPTENLGRLGFGVHKHHRSHCNSAAQQMCWPRVPSHETDTFDFNTHYH